MREDGVSKAYSLLSSILNEITLNDSPPSNDIPHPLKHGGKSETNQTFSPPRSTQRSSNQSSSSPSQTGIRLPKYSRQLHIASLYQPLSPQTSNNGNDPSTPTDSTPSLSPLYNHFVAKPGSISSPISISTSSYTIDKSDSFEDALLPLKGKEEAYSRAKSISTMGNSSLAIYLYGILERSDMTKNSKEYESIQESISALYHFQQKFDHFATKSFNRQRIHSKSQTTTTGLTSENASHASISSKNSSPSLSGGQAHILWPPDKVGINGSRSSSSPLSAGQSQILWPSDAPVSSLSPNKDSEERVDQDFDYEIEGVFSQESDPDFNAAAAVDESDIEENQNGEKRQENDYNKNEIKIRKHFFPKTPELRIRVEAPEIPVTHPKRIQMFGSEYARFLSSTVFSPAIPRKKNSIMQSLTRIKEHKTTSNTTLPPSSSSNAFMRTRILEDAPLAILSGPITDMVITLGNEPPPKGFYRITQTAEGNKADLTNKCGGTSIYLNVKKESNWDRAAQRPCVTAIAIIFPDQQEFVPPGFCVVKRLKSKSKRSSSGGSSSPSSHLHRSQDSTVLANLNFGTSGERIYLCYKKSREGNPITGIMPLQPAKQESIPDGYTVLERTPRNFVADLNSGAGPPLFLAYRQRLSNLETLRPQPLLLSQMEIADKTSLHAYFCTGGTVVKSKVGDLHIMDRSTHNMLSPSSVMNRRCLISKSKDTNKNFDLENLKKKKPRRRTSPAPGNTPRQTQSKSNSVSFVDGNVEMADNESVESFSSARSSEDKERSLTWKEFRPPDDSSLIAFDFIPVVTDGSGQMLSDPLRVEVITPILTACYTQHGGAAMLAVDGLISLLNDTDFFDADIYTEQASEHTLTLLDLAVQVVCDVATSTSRETHFKPCIDFVSGAIRYAKGNLGARTFGCALRFYNFVFYFGASVASSSSWPHSIKLENSRLGSPKNFDVDVPLLMETVMSGMSSHQSSALSLKELISLVLERLDMSSTIGDESYSDSRSKKIENDENIQEFIESLISEVISKSVDKVDVYNITLLASHQILRSGGSELFWHDMISSCGAELFGSDNPAFILAFGILANLVKVGSGNLRHLKETGDLVPRDVATKLLTLELILHFLDYVSESIGDRTTALSNEDKDSQQKQSGKVLSYAIRRLVVPLVLNNTTAGLEDPRVFRRLLKIVAKLWSCYRTHLKVEIAVLFEHFLLRVLRLGPQLRAFDSIEVDTHNPRVFLDHQLDVLSEIELWVENPIDLIELFMNYDMGEASSATHWKACQHICGALCKLAEQCGDIIAKQINSSRTSNESNSSNTAMGSLNQIEDIEELAQTRDAARSLQEKSLDVICHIIRVMMDASKQAYNHKRKGGVIRRMLNDGSWDSNDSFTNIDLTILGVRDNSTEHSEMHDFPDDFSETSFSSAEQSPKRQPRKPIVSRFSPVQKAPSPHNSRSMFTASTKSPKGSSVNFSPKVISSKNPSSRLKPPKIEKPPRPPMLPNVFRAPLPLKRHKSKVDELEEDQKRTQETLKVAFEIIENENNGLKKALDYLIACNFLLPGPRDVASFLLIHKKKLDPAYLGEYLGEGGHAGDVEYWNNIRYHFVRATSFVGMNVEKGLRSFLTKCGFRLPGEGQKISRLLETFAQCFWEDNAGDHSTCPFEHRDTIFLVVAAMTMLNTDLHIASTARTGSAGIVGKKKERKKMTRQEFIANLRGVDDAKNVSKTYLSEIYDSIEAHPIELHGPLTDNHRTPKEETLQDGTSPTSDWFAASNCVNTNTTQAFIANVKPGIELLRGLAIHEQSFLMARDDASALSCEFLCHIFKSLWHYFYGIVNATLDAVQLDPQSIGSCLSVLKYAINTTIYLDMGLERNAFITQLARIKYLKERGLEDGARIGLSLQETNYVKGEKFKQENWYEKFEDVCSSHKQVTDGIDQVNTLTRELRRAMQIDSRLNQAMHKVTRRIRNGEILLSDPTRSFIREGDLLKRCNRSGRYVLYKFFLFSDVLIYAHKSSTRGDYKIHEELPLYLMKISSVASRKGDKKRYCFQIHHPKKSFLVCAPTAESKTRWMEDIATVMSSSLDRKAGVHGARIGSVPKHVGRLK